ncbi:MAG: DUF5384 family protein [Alphaproteobacteria bacterium]
MKQKTIAVFLLSLSFPALANLDALYNAQQDNQYQQQQAAERSRKQQEAAKAEANRKARAKQEEANRKAQAKAEADKQREAEHKAERDRLQAKQDRYEEEDREYQRRLRALELKKLEARANRENDFIDQEINRNKAETDLIQSEADSTRTVSDGLADNLRAKKIEADTKAEESKGWFK